MGLQPALEQALVELNARALDTDRVFHYFGDHPFDRSLNQTWQVDAAVNKRVRASI